MFLLAPDDGKRRLRDLIRLSFLLRERAVLALFASPVFLRFFLSLAPFLGLAFFLSLSAPRMCVGFSRPLRAG